MANPLVMYPTLIVYGMLSISGIVDVIALILVFISLWMMSWTTYSRYSTVDKVKVFISGWILSLLVEYFGSFFGVNRIIMEFASETLTAGAFYALVVGYAWKKIEGNNEEGGDEEVRTVVDALGFVLIVLALISKAWMFLIIIAATTFVITLISYLYEKHEGFI